MYCFSQHSNIVDKQERERPSNWRYLSVSLCPISKRQEHKPLPESMSHGSCSLVLNSDDNVTRLSRFWIETTGACFPSITMQIILKQFIRYSVNTLRLWPYNGGNLCRSALFRKVKVEAIRGTLPLIFFSCTQLMSSALSRSRRLVKGGWWAVGEKDLQIDFSPLCACVWRNPEHQQHKLLPETMSQGSD